LAIGEIVTYEVTVSIPAGNLLTNAKMTDTMDLGLSFDECLGISGAGLTTSMGTLQNVCDNPTVDDGAGGTDFTDPNYGRRVVFDFGTLANPTGSAIDLVLTYNVIVLNNAANVDGVLLDNSAEFAWDDGLLGPDGATVDVVEPQLGITKQADTNLITVGTIVTFTITMQHTGNSAADAFGVVMTDVIPAEFDYVPGTLDCGTTAGSTHDPDAPVEVVNPPLPGTITAGWSVFAIGDVGVCTFQLQANTDLTDKSVENMADVAWESLDIDPGQQNDNVYSTERTYDPNDPANINNYHASSSLPLSPLTGGGGCKNCFGIPVTGFTPGVMTELSGEPAVPYAENMGVTLEIPKLKLKMPIVGVPLVKGNWEVDWLSGVGGWLQGTAFPGLSGNSVIMSHVVTRYGTNGPFARLNTLSVGDRILITAFNRQYVYEVTSVGNVAPNDITVFKHASKPVVTLMTCSKYNAVTKEYDGRLVVKTKLIQVSPAR
jgi:LPXTG-site transpeptidase (sortase) family protein